MYYQHAVILVVLIHPRTGTRYILMMDYTLHRNTPNQIFKHLMDKKFWTFKLSQKLVFVCKVCMIYFIVTDFEVLSKHFACISQHKVLVVHEIIA